MSMPLPAEFQIGHHFGESSVLKSDMCILPQFSLKKPSYINDIQKIDSLMCNLVEKDWVYVDNGSWFISSLTLRRLGPIHCNYIPVIRGSGDFDTTSGEIVDDMQPGSPIQSDFFLMKCNSGDGSSYYNIHSGVASLPHPTRIPSTTSERPLGLNILMIGFDSVSRLMWMRFLPKTYGYLVDFLGAVVMQQYNVVGDGTPAALLGMLTGHTEQELPEARRNHPGAETVDGHPWIWKDLKKLGYITQYAEDQYDYNAFNYRMLGFKEQPVAHYMRPYFKAAQKFGHLRSCSGSLPKHVVVLNYARQLFRTYPRRTPKFSFLFQAELSHDSPHPLELVDDDMVDFLKFMHDNGHFDNTLLMMMSDHGSRFAAARRSVQGKYSFRNTCFLKTTQY